MWFDFSVAFFLYVAILFIPAYYFLSALQVDQRISLSMAPAITAFSYSLSGIVLYFLGIKSSPLTIIFPWTFTFLVIGIFIRLKDGHDLLSDLLFIDFHIPLLYRHFSYHNGACSKSRWGYRFLPRRNGQLLSSQRRTKLCSKR